MPAATAGSPTDHGGVVVAGLPTVLVGGLPAARVTDVVVCPASTGPVPHVGGPIVGPGSGTVFVGGLPAALVGDEVAEAGPPSGISSGSGTVFVGR